MKLIFSEAAHHQLGKLDKSAQRRIVSKLNFFITREDPLAFSERLVDSQYGEWRFRIGDYRVLFDVHGDTIAVLKIGHRRDVYK